MAGHGKKYTHATVDKMEETSETFDLSKASDSVLEEKHKEIVGVPEIQKTPNDLSQPSPLTYVESYTTYGTSNTDD